MYGVGGPSIKSTCVTKMVFPITLSESHLCMARIGMFAGVGRRNVDFYVK